MTDAFDSDVVIYAATGDPRGARVSTLIERSPDLIGSVVLLTETLSHPLRANRTAETHRLMGLLARLELKPVNLEVADASVLLAAKYRLRAADAIHLATAVVWGAHRFHTNNRKDFGPHVEEVDVIWPAP